MNQKGFAGILVIIIAVALAGGLTYFIAVKKSEPPIENLRPGIFPLFPPPPLTYQSQPISPFQPPPIPRVITEHLGNKGRCIVTYVSNSIGEYIFQNHVLCPINDSFQIILRAVKTRFQNEAGNWFDNYKTSAYLRNVNQNSESLIIADLPLLGNTFNNEGIYFEVKENNTIHIATQFFSDNTSGSNHYLFNLNNGSNLINYSISRGVLDWPGSLVVEKPSGQSWIFEIVTPAIWDRRTDKNIGVITLRDIATYDLNNQPLHILLVKRRIDRDDSVLRDQVYLSALMTAQSVSDEQQLSVSPTFGELFQWPTNWYANLNEVDFSKDFDRIFFKIVVSLISPQRLLDNLDLGIIEADLN